MGYYLQPHRHSICSRYVFPAITTLFLASPSTHYLSFIIPIIIIIHYIYHHGIKLNMHIITILTILFTIMLGVFFPLTKVILPPQYAACSMAVSSVSVVLSSMSLWLYRKPAYISEPQQQTMNENDEDCSKPTSNQSIYIYNPVSFERYSVVLLLNISCKLHRCIILFHHNHHHHNLLRHHHHHHHHHINIYVYFLSKYNLIQIKGRIDGTRGISLVVYVMMLMIIISP